MVSVLRTSIDQEFLIGLQENRLMELIGLIIIVAFGLYAFGGLTRSNGSHSKGATSNVTADDDLNNDGPGFYLNKVDAMSHGAMFKMGDDDDGPGFYM